MVDLPRSDPVVPDAGEFMGATITPVLVAAKMSGLESLDVVAVTTLGRCTEQAHDRLPLAAVGLDAGPEQIEGNYVGGLVGDSAGEKFFRVPFQKAGVITDRAATSVLGTNLAGRLAAQVKADRRLGQLGIEVSRCGREEFGGKLLRSAPQVLSGYQICAWSHASSSPIETLEDPQGNLV